MKRTLSIALALMTWMAVLVQSYTFVRMFQQEGFSLDESVVNVVSFFTLHANVALALVLSLPLIVRKGRLYEAATASWTHGAVTVYITMVALIYHFVIRELWNPSGITLWMDIILHYLSPIGWWLYWFTSPKGYLKLRAAWAWLIFPFLYIVFILVRGHFASFYPYPFLDVDRIGLVTVLFNIAGMSFLFWCMGLFVWLIDRGWGHLAGRGSLR